MAGTCSAWGCKEPAVHSVPDPRYSDALSEGRGVPWHRTCGKPIYRSASGLMFVHSNPKKWRRGR